MDEYLFCRERFAEELENTGELLVDIGTDQTNLKRPFSGGYVPAQVCNSVY